MTEYYTGPKIKDLRKLEGTGTSPIYLQSWLYVEGAVLDVDKNLTFTNGSDVQGYMKIETNGERPSTP